ncbi:MAG TPA: Rrf2 family transcriptional regulator [Candidatus Acidoferrales bacterium]|nr:Rrf2 family transcriptional regulator [Candidatus Acidoferrales bacterium]
MIYSKPCEYAVRALVFLTRFPDRRAVQGAEIAEGEGVPAPILGKVLQELVRKGLLESRRGPGGGFRLARDPQLITLRDVVAAIDGLDQFAECAVGLEHCSDESLCPLHETWKALRTHVMNYLQDTTLADMAAAVARKSNVRLRSKRARAR